jgi:hypothetical protein
MSRLRFFEVYIDLRSPTIRYFYTLSSLMDTLCVSLTSPATLEHLKFNILFPILNNDFDFDIFYENLREADVWSHLDSITTHPTSSRLQRVDVNINYSLRYDDHVQKLDEDKVVKAVLDSLPLLRTKGILFVKAAVGG